MNIIKLGGSDIGYSGDGSTTFQIGKISCMVVNKNILYMCDYDYSVIRRFNLETKIISTFMGTQSNVEIKDGLNPLETKLKNPVYIGFDNNNTFYVSDAGNYCIRYINGINRVKTIVGTLKNYGNQTLYNINVQSDAIALTNPTSFDFDKNNNLILCDSDSNAIYMVNKEKRMTLLCGNGATAINMINKSVSTLDVYLNKPYGISINTDGSIYITS
jgi:uncharacterized protein YjiK